MNQSNLVLTKVFFFNCLSTRHEHVSSFTETVTGMYNNFLQLTMGAMQSSGMTSLMFIYWNVGDLWMRLMMGWLLYMLSRMLCLRRSCQVMPSVELSVSPLELYFQCHAIECTKFGTVIIPSIYAIHNSICDYCSVWLSCTSTKWRMETASYKVLAVDHNRFLWIKRLAILVDRWLLARVLH